MPPVLQGDFRTFWQNGAYIARVSGLFAWPMVCHWPVLQFEERGAHRFR